MPDQAWLARATAASFRLEGIEVGPDSIVAEVIASRARRRMRPRADQRLRNHAAALLCVERLLRTGQSLQVANVLRWYTSVSAGLSTTMLAGPKLDRLTTVVSQVNTPHQRIAAAMREIIELHLSILRDELVPSFHGILARLLLHFHLGRCGLRPMVPDFDLGRPADPRDLLRRVVTRIEESYA